MPSPHAKFAQQYGAIAQRAGQRLGVDPSLLLTQWGLETGWGKSVIPGTNNLGNIKDFRKNSNGVTAVDNMNGSVDKYRKFATPDEFADHFAGLIERRYPAVIGSGNDANKFATALKRGGYAEDPDYVNKIVSTARNLPRKAGFLESMANFLIPAAHAAQPDIDPSQVIWDDEPIDASKVIWDDEPIDASKVIWDDEPIQQTQNQQPQATPVAPQAAAQAPESQPTAQAAAQPEERGFFSNLGAFVSDVPRQFGLTARHALDGVSQAAQIVTEPIRQNITDPLLRATGLIEGESKSLGQIASDTSNAIGLPTPQNETERIAADITKLMAGTAAFGGSAGAMGNLAPAGSVTAKTLTGLAANPGSQMASAAGSGLLGGSVREAGGSETEQMVASVAGGLLAPMALSGAQKAGTSLYNRFGPQPSADVERQLTRAAQNAGFDWEIVPEKIKQSIRVDAKRALRTGDLDGEALRRLIEFQRVGATPTRGTLTLDPAQITKEKNFAKLGINSNDVGLQNLGQIENANNRALINALNDSGANLSDDIQEVGRSMIQSLDDQIAARKSEVSRLYDIARDNSGRHVPLDGNQFTNQAAAMLDEAMVGGALPPGVRDKLNKIAFGEVPFDVHYAEQLKTQIAKLQRATNDGQTKMALGIVRSALDDAPILPGATASMGDDAINAFNAARKANREMMQWIESSPALQAIYKGDAVPDNFVQKFVLNQGATSKDVRTLSEAALKDPQIADKIKGAITQHLKSKALNGAMDEVGKFSASGYNKALSAIGDRKLSAFFDASEIEQLKSIGKVANYTTVQPRGSAVNNSNTATTIGGWAVNALDGLNRRVPIPGLHATIRGSMNTWGDYQARQLAPALVRRAQVGLLDAPRSNWLLPASVSGLLATPVSPDSQ